MCGTCQHPEKRRPADQFHSHVLCQTAARKLRRDKQPGSKILTTDEKASLEKLEESIKYVDGRYQVAIPWKDDECALPNNYEMALRRLLNTEKRLLKNPEIGETYTNNINQYRLHLQIRSHREEPPKEVVLASLPGCKARPNNNKDSHRIRCFRQV